MLAHLGEPAAALEILHRIETELPSTQAVPLATWAHYFEDPELALEAFGPVPRGAQTADFRDIRMDGYPSRVAF